jgi:hypothetical protein
MQRLLAVLPLLSAALAAQNITAYPIDNPVTNTSQNIPIAGGSIANWDEAHSQFYFPRQFLPAVPAMLTGIEWASTIGGSIPYERFELYMGTAAGPGLTSTFANNINQPVLVYSLNPGTITWVGGNSWQGVTFSLPYLYDGVSNLVLEVRKKIDRPNNPTIQQATQGLFAYPNRADLPTPIWTWGVYGSGAVDGPTSTATNNTLLLNRLTWLAVPTLTINSTRNTTGNSNRGYFHIGATVTATTHGNPGNFFVSAIDLADRFWLAVAVDAECDELGRARCSRHGHHRVHDPQQPWADRPARLSAVGDAGRVRRHVHERRRHDRAAVLIGRPVGAAAAQR